MRDHSENTLRAAVKCLRETVAPAVDADDHQAVEQLRLTIDFLEFLRTRLYDVHSRHRYELGYQMQLARSLLDDAADCSPRAASELARSLAQATSAYGDAATHTRDLRESSEDLLGTVRATVREASGAPEAVRERIAAKMLEGSAPLVELESAWYVPFGFEPDPGGVSDLDSLLAGRTGTHR